MCNSKPVNRLGTRLEALALSACRTTEKTTCTGNMSLHNEPSDTPSSKCKSRLEPTGFPATNLLPASDIPDFLFTGMASTRATQTV